MMAPPSKDQEGVLSSVCNIFMCKPDERGRCETYDVIMRKTMITSKKWVDRGDGDGEGFGWRSKRME